MVTFKTQGVMLAALVATAGFAAVPAQAALIAFYEYNNVSNIGKDSSGRGNNLQANSGATFGNGKYGAGLELAGGVLSASGALSGLPVGGSSYSIASWINPDTAGSGNVGGIAGWGNYGAAGQTNALRMNGASGLHNYWWNNDLTAAAGSNLTTGEGADGWHFVAATYNASTRVHNIYVDNILRATRTMDSASVPNVGNASFTIGRTGGTEWFDGQLDNTSIFSHALSMTELTAIAANNYAAYGVTVNPGGGLVPEPGSLALFGSGLLGLLALRRRRA